MTALSKRFFSDSTRAALRPRRARPSLLIALASVTVFLGLAAPRGAAAESGPRPPALYTYSIGKTFAHDGDCFTQGLVYAGGNTLYESCGQYGESNVREVDLQTGAVRKRTDNEKSVFAEGLALLGGKLHQIAWLTSQGFVYDPSSLKQTGTFNTPLRDGWGIAAVSDREFAITDGTHRLSFIDEHYRLKRSVEVHDNGMTVPLLNEIEFIDGEVWANVWMTECIARVDPGSGRVVGWVLLHGLRDGMLRETAWGKADVLNGVAWDAQRKRLFVTGKYWKQLFQLDLRKVEWPPEMDLARARAACMPQSARQLASAMHKGGGVGAASGGEEQRGRRRSVVQRRRRTDT